MLVSNFVYTRVTWCFHPCLYPLCTVRTSLSDQTSSGTLSLFAAQDQIVLCYHFFKSLGHFCLWATVTLGWNNRTCLQELFSGLWKEDYLHWFSWIWSAVDLGTGKSLWCLGAKGGAYQNIEILLPVPDGSQRMLVGHPEIRSEAVCWIRVIFWFIHRKGRLRGPATLLFLWGFGPEQMTSASIADISFTVTSAPSPGVFWLDSFLLSANLS